MALEPPLWSAGAEGSEFQHSALLDRRLIDVIFNEGGGVIDVANSNLRVVPRIDGANMTVDILAGTCVIQGGSVANQGKYICRSTSLENRPVITAPGSGTRTDIVVARVRDSEVSGILDGFFLEVLEDSDEGDIPDDCTPLAKLTIPSGTSSINAGNIQDLRVEAIINSNLIPGTIYTNLSDLETSINTINTNLTSHTNATTAHSATSIQTANRIVIRDSSGRARFANPSNNLDAATKGYVDDSIISGIRLLSSGTSSASAFNIAIPTGSYVYLKLRLRGTLTSVGDLVLEANASAANLFNGTIVKFRGNGVTAANHDEGNGWMRIAEWSTVVGTSSIEFFFASSNTSSSSVRYHATSARYSASENATCLTQAWGAAVSTITLGSLRVRALGAPSLSGVNWELYGANA